MYPDSVLQWIGGVAILVVLLVVLGIVFFSLDAMYQRHIEKKHGAPKDDDEGES